MTEDVVAMLGRRDWGDRRLSAMLTSREIQFAAETAASSFLFFLPFREGPFLGGLWSVDFCVVFSVDAVVSRNLQFVQDKAGYFAEIFTTISACV